MRILIAGAGAIGAYLGAKLSLGGHDVTLFARGAHLDAMRSSGVVVRGPEGDFTARPAVSGTLADTEPPDVVFLGIKAHALPRLAPDLAPVVGSDTVVVSTQNGIPWWYFQRHGGELEGLRLERVDPGGVIARTIDAQRVIGSIVYFSTRLAGPGIVQHLEGDRISLGELDGSRSDRIRRLAAALNESGLRARVTTRIRHEIWVKLLGNASFNPVSALTGATLVQMARHPESAALVRRIMEEVAAVAARLGIELPVSIDQRMAGAEQVGEHKTSMLQDLEAGRPMEIDAIVGAVVELGERLAVSMPHTQTIYASVKLLAAVRQQAGVVGQFGVKPRSDPNALENARRGPPG
ncbi:MAG: 2-dehydropantoate 2-reductase [Acidobacteria bacterium]|nr:2-dehydropantoate 2-reductase [Acidobacteriota bacterium]